MRRIRLPSPRRVLEWRVFEQRNAAVLLALAFFLVGAVSVHNLVSRNIARGHVDEYHTLFLGSYFLSPWTDASYGVQVGEMNRWFVRLLYPLGIYYMNTRMGGDWEGETLDVSGLRAPPARNFGYYKNVRMDSDWEGETADVPSLRAPPAREDGWQYPGGYYLKEKFRGASWNFFESSDFERDSNVQDYVFAMRLAFGLMAILSFSLVIYALCSKANAVASAIYGFLILLNTSVYKEFSFFYSETSLFIVFNLAMFLYLRAETITNRISIFFGFLSAAALGIKLTGVLIAIPAFLHVLVNRKRISRKDRAQDWRFELYVLTLAISFVGINFWSGSLFDFINESLANVYNYGGRRTDRDIPLRYFSEIFSELGGVFVISCIAVFLWLVSQWRRDLAPVYALGVVIAIIVLSLSNATVWAVRNVLSLYVAMSFIIALGVGKMLEKAADRNPKSDWDFIRICSAATMAIFLIFTAAVPAVWLPSLKDIFFSEVRMETGSCDDIAALGLSAEDAVRLTGREDAVAFPRLGGADGGGAHAGQSGRPSPEWYREYTDFDCLVIDRRGENKHISNYFAPFTHDMRIRVGNFFFYGPHSMSPMERARAYRAAWRSVIDRVPTARSDFDVHIDGNTIIFVKQSCAPEDTDGYFVLRIYPVVERDVPERRRGDPFHGFVFKDFIFEDYGARFDDKCLLQAPLPTWDIARVRAGQTDGFRQIWEVDIPFADGAAAVTNSTP